MVPERGEEGFLFSLSLFFLSQVEAFFFPVKTFLYSTFSLSLSLDRSLSLKFSFLQQQLGYACRYVDVAEMVAKKKCV